MKLDAEQYLHQGNLKEALANLQEQIRKDAANPKLRVFLFQLLVVLGEWQRALTQLQVLEDLDASQLLMTQTYRAAVLCEALRTEVFAGKRSPLIFGEPQRWVALLIEALRLDAEGHFAEAASLRREALELAPATSGSLDGVGFEWIADADSRLGPTLEAIVNGRYYWIPFQQVSRIEFDEPADLRDVVWMPAQLAWVNGGAASCLIPTRYPGSDHATDFRLQMARMTDWKELAEGCLTGMGQRLLATNVDDYALMDIRKIALNATGGTP